jgi:UDPglucose 6-dehydrogenase
MKLTVFGCGYLGAVHAAAMAHLGHDVVGIDVDAAKVAMLNAGSAPFFEPGLPELLAEGLSSGKLRFSTDIEDARGAAVHFIAVGTPSVPGGSNADLRFVDSAVDSVIAVLDGDALVVGKSTVPVGTASAVAERVRRATGATVAWNPEFLREGLAVRDTLRPDRLVYGLPSDEEEAARAAGRLNSVYRAALEAGTPLITTDYATSELVKVAANAFLATKISFINAMAEIAEVTGADVTHLADAIGMDARIGRRFLNAGVGFGGGCLPKDIRAFAARAEELGRGESVAFLKEVDSINLRRRSRVVDLAQAALGGSVEGRRIAVLGLAFKPDSDDIRDSPALDIALRLSAAGAEVVATDPQAIDNAKRSAPGIGYARRLEDAVGDAELLILLTEWSEYRYMDPAELSSSTTARTIIDGRNCLDAAAWRAEGWTYTGLGRP